MPRALLQRVEAITLEQAKQVMAGAEAEARKNNWNVVITILDSGGNIVMVQRMVATRSPPPALRLHRAFRGEPAS